MDAAKTLATALGISRALFGLSYVVQPGRARTTWIGRAARKPGAQVLIRSQGIRDVVLGGGALRAVVRDDPSDLRGWMLGHAVSDVTDLLATWIARDSLPARRARLAMGVAAVSTLVGAAAAATAGRAAAP